MYHKSNPFRFLGALIIFISTSFSLLAQTGSIRGFVYNQESGEPVIFTNVYLKGTSHGAATDVNGYYMISKVPAGDYVLTVTSLGYDTITENITLKSRQVLNKKLYVKPNSVELDIFDVSAEKQEDRTEVKMSVVKITPKEMKQMPTVGGQADIAQYMQVIPGVIFTGDQGGQLYIRGGSPIQNKVLLDGMVIYNPFHSIGLFSVFDTEIIRNADIYTGGFNAEYGGRISSIMDITTRDGNKKRFGGKVNASPFGAGALLEGPLIRAKTPGGSTVSFVLSGKTSYLEQSSKVFYNYIDTAGLPFNFTDLYGKISLNGSNGSKFNVFGFNFNDRVRYQSISDLSWDSWGVGSNFLLVPDGSPVLVEGNFAYSEYGISLQEKDEKPRSSSINGFNLGLKFTYFVKDDEIKYGIEALGFATEFEFFNSVNRRIQQQQNTTELAGFVKYKMNRGKFVLEPSFRLHYYASLNESSPEPRLGAKYNVTDFLRVKLAAGMYSQNLIAANSDRDIVNLFYGFLGGPDNLQSTFTDEKGEVHDVTHRLQKANHAIFGVEADLTKRIGVNVETYYKKFTQLSNLNRNKLFEDNDLNRDRPDQLKKDFIIETGDAYGVDFVLKYDYKRTYLWAVYSLGYVTRWDGVMSYFPVFDRRHNINLVGSYTFGKDLNWEVSGRWNMGSGFPFTQTMGYYERFNFNEGINTDYVSTNGDLGIQYAPLNQGRLPYYHRLDFNLKRHFVISDHSICEASIGVTNGYNRENIFYFDRVRHERVNQLPIMPSAGLSMTF